MAMNDNKRQWWWYMKAQSVQIRHQYADNFQDDMFAMSGDALTRNTQIANRLTKETNQ